MLLNLRLNADFNILLYDLPAKMPARKHFTVVFLLLAVSMAP